MSRAIASLTPGINDEGAENPFSDPTWISRDALDIEMRDLENRAMEIHANCKAGNHEWERGFDRVFCTWCGARYPLTQEDSNGKRR